MTPSSMLFAHRHPPAVFDGQNRSGESISAYFGIRIDAAINLVTPADEAGQDPASRFRTSLAGQHRLLAGLLGYAGRAAVDFRIVAIPDNPLQIFLLGRTWSDTNSGAADHAEGLRGMILATLPRLAASSEITSRDELAALLDPLQHDSLEGAIISKRVINGQPSRRDANIAQYLSVAPFNLVVSDWTPLYQALSLCRAPTVISVGIFPATVPPAFHTQLADISAYYGRLARETEIPGGLYFGPQRLAPDPFAVDAVTIFREYQRRYAERAFGMRIQVAASRLTPGLVESLGAAVAATDTWTELRLDSQRVAGTYQSTSITGPRGSELLRNNLSAIDNECVLVPPTDRHQQFMSLLSNLGDASEAACAFRLPIATNGSIPGFPVRNQVQPQAGSNGRGRTSVFVSYRREDTRYVATRLVEKLVERFEGVFMDVDTIDPGIDFTEAIEGAVSDCDVLLALIGHRWADAVDEHGRRRLDDPDDWVAREIRIALDRGVPVIPVLVDGARMPHPGELPPVLLPLTTRQSTSLRYESFAEDIARLRKAIEGLPDVARSPARP